MIGFAVLVAWPGAYFLTFETLRIVAQDPSRFEAVSLMAVSPAVAALISAYAVLSRFNPTSLLFMLVISLAAVGFGLLLNPTTVALRLALLSSSAIAVAGSAWLLASRLRRSWTAA